jgi:mono/diheme cytochrome c family protein
MKKIPVILGFLALFGGIAMLIQQHCDAQGPSVQLNQDMHLAPSRPRSAPPAGSIPYGELNSTVHPASVLFNNHCASCHGSNGNGQSYVASYPGMPGVGNLSTSSKSLSELQNSIRNGRGAMPTFQRRLSEPEILILTDYIHNHLRNK